MGNRSHPGILEVIMDWPEGKDFGVLPEEEVTHAEMASLCNKLPENEKQYAGRWLCEALHDKSQKLLKEKVSQAGLQT